jgi:hypothetical protein
MVRGEIGDTNPLQPQLDAPPVQKGRPRQGAHRAGTDAALAAGAAFGSTSGPFWPQAAVNMPSDASASSPGRVNVARAF